jgi:hypothetical protein
MSANDGRSTNQNKQLGRSIEKYRARARDGETTPEAWFDVEASDGTLVEVKSTEVRLSYGRRGRYQLVEVNHENLLDHGGVYDFVLRDDGETAVERTGVPASTVEDVIDEHDLKWPDGGKLKLPWSYVHDVSDVPGEGE